MPTAGRIAFSSSKDKRRLKGQARLLDKDRVSHSHISKKDNILTCPIKCDLGSASMVWKGEAWTNPRAHQNKGSVAASSLSTVTVSGNWLDEVPFWPMWQGDGLLP